MSRMLLVKVRLHFKRATVKRKNNRKQSKLPLRYLTLAAYKCSMEKKEKRKGKKKKRKIEEKTGAFQARLNIACSIFLLKPLKIGSDSRNENSGCPSSNHRMNEAGTDLQRSPGPNRITVIFQSITQANVYFLFSLYYHLHFWIVSAKKLFPPLYPQSRHMLTFLYILPIGDWSCFLRQYNISSSIYGLKSYIIFTASFLSFTVLYCSFIIAS